MRNSTNYVINSFSAHYPNWETHYTFGKKEEKSANQIDISKSSSQIKNADSIELAPSCEPETPTSEKKTRRTAHRGEKRHDACLSRNSIDLLFINAVIPSLFAYARTHHDERTCCTCARMARATAGGKRMQRCGLGTKRDSPRDMQPTRRRCSN